MPLLALFLTDQGLVSEMLLSVELMLVVEKARAGDSPDPWLQDLSRPESRQSAEVLRDHLDCLETDACTQEVRLGGTERWCGGVSEGDGYLKSEVLGWGLVDGLVLSQSWRIFFFVVVVFFLDVRCVVDVVYRVRAEREG